MGCVQDEYDPLDQCSLVFDPFSFLFSPVAGGRGILVCRSIDRLNRGPVHVAARLRIVEISSRGRVLSKNGVV